MHFDSGDQAAGLRQLVRRSAGHLWIVAGVRPKVGATSWLVGAAVALASQGRDVLILDERISSGNVSSMLKLKPRYDLLQVLRGDVSLASAFLKPLSCLGVMPAARAFDACAGLAFDDRRRLLGLLGQLCRQADLVLVDARPDVGGTVLSGLPDVPARLLLMSDASTAGITASYKLIKRMHQRTGLRRVAVIFNRVKNAGEGIRLFHNLREASMGHLGVPLQCLGYMPVDESMQRATQWAYFGAEETHPAPGLRVPDDLSAGLLRDPWAKPVREDVFVSRDEWLANFPPEPISSRLDTCTLQQV